MKHHLTEKELIEYQFKLASDAQMKEATEHLEGCGQCRVNLEKLQRKYAALDLLGEKAEISEDLILRVTEQASRPVVKKIAWFKRPVWMSSAAAVLVVGLLLVANQMSKDGAKQREVAHELMPMADKIEVRSSRSIAPMTEMEVASKPEITQARALQKNGKARTATLAMGPKEGAADMYAAPTAKDKAADDAISEEPPFAPASAIELVTLPRRDKVQLTIYNSAFRTSVSNSEEYRGFGGMSGYGNSGGYGVGYMEGNPGIVVNRINGQIHNRPGGLIMVIQETIEPDTWFDLSDTGEGTIKIHDNNKLVVRQTREIHQKIEKLLQALKSLPGEQPRRDSSIALDRAEPLIYRQIEQIVDLSDLKAEMTFGEVIEKLENSVRPPIQIQPNWRDLLENAEVEPTTPARMGPLRGIKLRKALEILISGVTSSQLGEFGELTYVVDEGVILIGTLGMLRPKMETRVYDISNLDIRTGITSDSDAAVAIEEKKVQDMRPRFVSRRPVTTLPNSLTLVRERRNLTMKKGWNWLQFMWANTLIDPTSLSLEPLEQVDKIDIQQLVFPARLRELGRWLIHSEVSGQVPFEITYFTSGISWRAFYMGTLEEDEKTMQLQGYVRVANNSGEDYEEAETRLIVGNVHILDEIAELAKRQYPYNRPISLGEMGGRGGFMGGMLKGQEWGEDRYLFLNGDVSHVGAAFGKQLDRKEIRKEGLSEYFLYTIEGTETIPNQWGKRLLSFDAKDIEVESLYKYDEERWGNQTIRFVKFANDKEHNLGQTPIPNGNVKIYGKADREGFLSYVGGTNIKYIPVDEEVELNLGPARLAKVEPKLMDFKTDNYMFDRRGNVAGWDEIRTWKIEIINTRELPIEIEITRSFGTVYWSIQSDVAYEKYDAAHARFNLNPESKSKQVFEYTVTTYHGTRENTLAENN